jgi:hypothetical protein
MAPTSERTVSIPRSTDSRDGDGVSDDVATATSCRALSQKSGDGVVAGSATGGEGEVHPTSVAIETRRIPAPPAFGGRPARTRVILFLLS